MKIDWAALHLNPHLMHIAKAFVAYALEKYAPVTAFKASVIEEYWALTKKHI
ncbi:hypothetical protein PS928_06803 [Pseudomonas fluorescens]|jgi:hypothetical protein|uniref:Uncharacterized protein n=2 Tax=Pseudomonas TaxID=286 RepID=A0A5E7VW76_PSEFL|nr:hypothetical protein PS928_06803 [Pseudomonas fluorescens]